MERQQRLKPAGQDHCEWWGREQTGGLAVGLMQAATCPEWCLCWEKSMYAPEIANES